MTPHAAPTLRRRVHGPAVRAIRESLGLRSSEVADSLGVSRGFYSRIEAGDRQCNPAVQRALAERLRVTIDQITVVS